MVVLVFCLQLTFRLLLPKLKLIWQGEKVVVARILQEHREIMQAKEQKKELHEKFGDSIVSGMDVSQPGYHQNQNPARHVNSKASTIPEDSSIAVESSSVAVGRPKGIPSEMLSENEEEEELEEDSTKEIRERCPPQRQRKIVVAEGYALPTKLAMNVLSVSNEMSRVNEVSCCIHYRQRSCTVPFRIQQYNVIYFVSSEL